MPVAQTQNDMPSIMAWLTVAALRNPATHDAAVAAISALGTAAAHISVLLSATVFGPRAHCAVPIGNGQISCAECPLQLQGSYFDTLTELIDIHGGELHFSDLSFRATMLSSILLRESFPGGFFTGILWEDVEIEDEDEDEGELPCKCKLALRLPRLRLAALLLRMDPQGILDIFLANPTAHMLPLEFW
ncbi:hypothetical protein H9P43_009253 [Blastocladiella emersonii ATCC 22665]|nr:hypothetical protein H9P43_009253 [Blastocladiella emersonii ATCC 22665]